MAKPKKQDSNDSKSGLDITKDSLAIQTQLYGTDGSLSKENRSIIDKVQSTVASTRNSISAFNGGGMNTFKELIGYNEHIKKIKEGSSEESKDYGTTKKYFEDKKTQGRAADILAGESFRINNYRNYDTIVAYAPVLQKGIDAYVDAVLSPDDIIGNNEIGIDYTNILADESHVKSVEGNLDVLRNMYEIDDKLPEIVGNAIKYGDEFYTSIAINDEFDKIKTAIEKNMSHEGREGSLLEAYKENNSTFSKDGFIPLTESEASILNSFLSEDTNKLSNRDWETQIDTFMNNITFYNEGFMVAEDTIESVYKLAKEDRAILEKSLYSEESVNKKQSAIDMIGSNVSVKDENSQSSSPKSSSKGKTSGKRGKKDKDTGTIPGSIMKQLDRNKVVKLWDSGICYGYFYVEGKDGNVAEYSSMETLNGVFNNTFNNGALMNKTSSTAAPQAKKIKLILDMFSKRIGDKMSKEFLVKHPQFREMVFSIMKMSALGKEVKVTYLKPEEVHHFYPKLGSDGYGVSILKNSMYLGIIYASTLVSSHQMKLTRAPQKRVFYLETGEDEEYENVVNEFIKDLKTDDVKLNGTDINTVLNSISIHHDLFIPRIDGESPIEFSTLDGLDSSITDDFLEYLESKLIDSIGIPASFIQSSNEVDFSRELSIQNARFVRAITPIQRKIARPSTELVRSLYMNEWPIDENSELDLEKIKVDFPPPMSLNLSSSNETMNAAKERVDQLTEYYFDDEAEGGDSTEKFLFKRKLGRKYLPSIEWDEIDDLFNEARMEAARERVKKEIDEGSNDDTSDDEF